MTFFAEDMLYLIKGSGVAAKGRNASWLKNCS